ncbi:MAG: preprotein translocase subunit SecE [Phycisphaerae bacterium]|nr:preprotein translocase subunit SecE [Phycisphaerae bacterium]
MDRATDAGEQGFPADRGRPTPAREPGKETPKRGGFFQVYKPAQGYYTRLGSGLFFGVLILWGAKFTFEQMDVFHDADVAWTDYLRYGVPVALLCGLGLLLYWLLCVNQRAIDFFIATEGEMKKVSWSSRREVIGSTKVVIATVLILGTLLFVVDLLFMAFFSSIGVLKISPGLLGKLFGAD